MAQVWQLHQRTRRLEVVNEVTALAGSALDLPGVYQAMARAVARLIRFTALGVGLLDPERHELRLFDIVMSPDDHGDQELRDGRLPSAGSIAQWVAEQRAPIRIDDLSDPRLPPVSRERFRRRGFQSAILAPLITQGEAIGSLFVGHSAPRAFSAEDVEILSEVASRWPPPSSAPGSTPRRSAARRPWARSMRRAGSSARGCTFPPCSPPSAGR